MRALVIDDSRSMRMYLAALIEEQGWQTESACDGQDALRVLDQARRLRRRHRGLGHARDGRPRVCAPPCAAIRDTRGLKLLMLTARDGTDEVVQGAGSGRRRLLS
jgi:DNA-binding response OmpR family regulator